MGTSLTVAVVADFPLLSASEKWHGLCQIRSRDGLEFSAADGSAVTIQRSRCRGESTSAIVKSVHDCVAKFAQLERKLEAESTASSTRKPKSKVKKQEEVKLMDPNFFYEAQESEASSKGIPGDTLSLFHSFGFESSKLSNILVLDDKKLISAVGKSSTDQLCTVVLTVARLSDPDRGSRFWGASVPPDNRWWQCGGYSS